MPIEQCHHQLDQMRCQLAVGHSSSHGVRYVDEVQIYWINDAAGLDSRRVSTDWVVPPSNGRPPGPGS